MEESLIDSAWMIASRRMLGINKNLKEIIQNFLNKDFYLDLC